MPIATHPGDTDLLIPLPGEGDDWDPHTIHTHYFGLSIPEEQLGGFVYIRYQPAFPLCQGGVAIFQGTDNISPLDMEFLDFQITMPYPEVVDGSITTANGLRIEFPEPGRVARISYTSKDGATSLDLEQTAVTPLFARGHVVPGEDDHHSDPGAEPGGTEQFMHCVGEIVVRGERYDVDCFAARDRSWRQVRTEDQGGARPMPPVGWSPMYFGQDLVFNQISFEPEDTSPAWSGLFTVPPDAPTHHYAWVYSDGEVREITKVRRDVLEYHPSSYVAIKQEIEAEDEAGNTYRFTGEAIAASAMPAWPNAGFNDTVFRWEDERGRVNLCN